VRDWKFVHEEDIDELIKLRPKIEKVRIMTHCMEPHVMNKFLKWIGSEYPKKITVFHLRCITSQIVSELANTIRNLSHLQTLILASTEIEDEEPYNTGPIVRALGNKPFLRVLHLLDFKQISMKLLFCYLKYRQIESLSLEDTNKGRENEACILADHLRDMKQLSWFNIENFSVSPLGTEAILKACAKCPKLATLYATGHVLKTDGALDGLVALLKKSCIRIIYLSDAQSTLNDERLLKLAEGVRVSYELTSLEFSSGDGASEQMLTREGVCKFVQAIGFPLHLSWLHFDAEVVGDELTEHIHYYTQKLTSKRSAILTALVSPKLVRRIARTNCHLTKLPKEVFRLLVPYLKFQNN